MLTLPQITPFKFRLFASVIINLLINLEWLSKFVTYIGVFIAVRYFFHGYVICKYELILMKLYQLIPH